MRQLFYLVIRTMKNNYALLLLLLTSFSVTAQKWTEVASLPDSVYARNHPITFSLDGYGYFGTGYNHDDTTLVFDDFYKYDPDKNEWSAMEPFPGEPRGFGYGATTNGKAYAGFGLGYVFDSTRGRYAGIPYGDLWSFDPISEKWTELATCPCIPRWHPAFVAVGDKVFVGLGGAATGNLKDWWEYDITRNSWSQKPDFPGVRRHHPYYFAIDSLVYVGFGHGQGIFKDFYCYNPRTEQWKQISDLPSEGRVAGQQFSHGGKGYVISGQGEDHRNLDSGEFWMYDAELDTWESRPAHPGTGRWAPGTFVIKDKLYFVSGYTTVNMKDMWVYDLPSTSTVGIKPQSFEEGWTIYPNPSNGEITLKGVPFGSDIQVFNSVGQMVLSQKMNSERLSLSQLPGGTYLVKGQQENGAVKTLRISIIH